MTRGLVVAAPASGAGKSTVAVGLLGALARSGRAVAAAKCGPDYIDPMFHAAVLGRPSPNLDPWAMPRALLGAIAARQAAEAELLLIEGVMGLFDGALGGGGSTADLAAALDLPVVLVVDVAHQAQSAAALVQGFRDFRSDVRLAGVILNRIGSARHAALVTEALALTGVPVLGAVPRDPAFALPSRHLGLVPAGELDGLEGRLDHIANVVAEALDLDRFAALAEPLRRAGGDATALPPLGRRIAIAHDDAFCFIYPHLLDGWRDQGASFAFFSPLADEGPPADVDAVFLPGGYPELHGGALAAAEGFRRGMAAAAGRGALVYGECGGYMALGEGLVDGEGERHRMLGLLPLETSFAERRLHLGYRRLKHSGALPWPERLAAHEFHYAAVLHEGDGAPLFEASAADGRPLPAMGRRTGRVMGSFAHVIAAA